MKFRECIFSAIEHKLKELKLLKMKVNMAEMEIEILQRAFDENIGKLSEEEKLEMKETLRQIIIEKE
jgi:hypothetical protein